METLIEKPTLQEQQVARESLSGLSSAMQGRSDQVTIQIQENHQAITLPRKALELLSFILSNMASGKTVSLIPSDSEVSTQQAADLLRVSRPHLVKLLGQGAIPFKKVGTHRRILLEDLLVYEAEQKGQRKKQLQRLAQQAQELNLGYE